MTFNPGDKVRSRIQITRLRSNPTCYPMTTQETRSTTVRILNSWRKEQENESTFLHM